MAKLNSNVDEEVQYEEISEPKKNPIGTDFTFKRKIVWLNVVFLSLLHIGAVYSIFFLPQIKLFTWILIYLKVYGGFHAVCAGAHRLFSHRTYKAVFGLRVALMLLHTLLGQNSLYIWARDHRLHHKFSDTDADPHNASRGFFFSHCGWLMCRKHPLVVEKGRTIDMSDLEADPVVMFQYKYYTYLYLMITLTTVYIPVLLWNETLHNSFFVTYVFLYTVGLNVTWCINSVAHLYGTKPYDKSIKPVNNRYMVFGMGGEGYHNYHHTFPCDYRTSEFAQSNCLTTDFIEWTNRMGWSYDLKTVTNEHVAKRRQRTGDLSAR